MCFLPFFLTVRALQQCMIVCLSICTLCHLYFAQSVGEEPVCTPLFMVATHSCVAIGGYLVREWGGGAGGSKSTREFDFILLSRGWV